MSAKLLAWGPRFRSIEAGLKNDDLAKHNKNVIVAGEKKVRVPLSGFDLPTLPTMKEGEDEKEYWDADERLVRKMMARGALGQADMGAPRRFIDALVTKELVLVMDPVTKDWVPLDEDAAPKPTAKNTWPFALASAVIAKVAGGQGEVPLATTDDGDKAASTANGSRKKNKKKQ